ncbi:MAG: T9SS type A sorting domain-containing protein, partial [Bacteroidia bacterium]
DMENWEAVSSGDEPVNWNSFMTASGGFSGFADVQIEESTDVRPGTAGTSSARIWSRDFGEGFRVFPNPTDGKFSIDLGAIYVTADILVSDINGRLIQSKTFGQEQVLNVSLKEPNGVYLISILAGDKRAVIRLIKN